MDAYLSGEASLFLKALNLASPRPKAEGFLIGHKRGQRYFVERVLPSQQGFFSRFENLYALDKLFEGKLIGFFTFQASKKKMKKILVPFAFGKLFLDIHLKQSKQMAIRPYVIDFANSFFLSPIRLKSFKRG